MILREPVTLKIGGGLDGNGNPIPVVDVPSYAELTPLTPEESFSAGRSPSSVSYRMVFVHPDVLKAATKVDWRGKTYDLVGPSMQCTANGELHHQECVVSRTTG